MSQHISWESYFRMVLDKELFAIAEVIWTWKTFIMLIAQYMTQGL